MAIAQILLTHGMADGEFGVSVDDIVTMETEIAVS